MPKAQEATIQNTKVYLCQIIGGDNRLKGSCAGYANP